LTTTTSHTNTRPDKIYFASDFHLGVPTDSESRKREDKIVRWLDEVSKDATVIFLVGDIFDFWFEYKHAIPKGFVRLQGKIASLVDSGIQVNFYIGNHDMWMFDYFEKELGVTIYRKEQLFTYGNKNLFIGHGDGLGPGDQGYKFIKKVFSNRFFQWCFARFHPNFGIGMANYWSRKSRAKGKEPQYFLGAENEWLVQYCEEYTKTTEGQQIDFFIFGHRHLPIDYTLSSGARYINLGDWINHCNYAVFDGETVSLVKFD
jgi:UDP-2,3-diacylglucosamine hydrolase